MPLHAMNEQRVTLHLLVPTTLRNGHANQWPSCPGVKQPFTGTRSQGSHAAAESQDLYRLQPGSPPPALCLAEARTVVRSR